MKCGTEGAERKREGVEGRRKRTENTRLGQENQMLLVWNQGGRENQRQDQEDWMPGEDD